MLTKQKNKHMFAPVRLSDFYFFCEAKTLVSSSLRGYISCEAKLFLLNLFCEAKTPYLLNAKEITPSTHSHLHHSYYLNTQPYHHS